MKIHAKSIIGNGGVMDGRESERCFVVSSLGQTCYWFEAFASDGGMVACLGQERSRRKWKMK